ncbi:diguanylate phosphodiesterase [Rhodopseudomonas palustris HaA2]|uniref:Diguanylate phosphodiesterase n=1 Tax=Rhodopseudomonas palustris (strain HaA2) TaxID=316058 RepID=Q2J0W7_RHOP2|nr:EAL domain-containing protein [Rhodopseudomonas palustris]ABD05893.1 diguanylate phosphodiesterase [Rhodopseudomonas palustris HaA2]
MIRISTIFIAICMALISASLGAVVYALAGFNAVESAIVALATLSLFILYNAVSIRLRDRSDAGHQIADLSRGTADLARQIAEFGRRLAAVEGKVMAANAASQDRTQVAMNEIGELGLLVKQLAASVATHEDMLNSAATGAAPRRPPMLDPEARVEDQQTAQPAAEPLALTELVSATVTALPATPKPARDPAQVLVAVKTAIETGRLDIYLQPLVSLPQRKVRFYEIVTRLRDGNDQILAAGEFLTVAETAGLMGRIDHAVMLRAVQVLRRLMVRNKDVGVFVNIAAATLSDAESFAQCLDFLEANKALAPSFVLEFKQSTLRNLGPLETEHLAALAQRGFRFSIDHVTDLRFEPRDLADRGVRFIKVPAALLLDQREHPVADIHPADLSDLLGRFGIDLIAERIEGERAVVDLLDYDVRFGQGFLFAAPRPLRPETAPSPAPPTPGDKAKQDIAPPYDPGSSPKGEPARIDPPRAATGLAALARRAVGPA